jgi:transcriptional regulator with XRE-family HTH domain
MTTANPNLVTGQNIQALRTKLGLTQEALAQYLNTSREQVAYYEAGSRTVSSSHLTRLANLFCMNEFDFYEADNSKRDLNIVFAFRADTLQPTDLESIARFKKIVRNYLNMKAASTDE